MGDAEEDDEEAGGFSAEAGWEEGGKYAKVKWEQDEMDAEEDDEEAGGFSAEAGYEEGGKYAKVKWEQDEMDDEEAGGLSRKWTTPYLESWEPKNKWEQDEMDEDVGWGDDFGKPPHTRPHRPDAESLGNWINFRL